MMTACATMSVTTRMSTIVILSASVIENKRRTRWKLSPPFRFLWLVLPVLRFVQDKIYGTLRLAGGLDDEGLVLL